MTTITPSPTQTKPPICKTPVFIQTIQVMFDQFGVLEKYHQKYGDIFYTPRSPGFPPFVIFNDPKAIEKVFTADPNLFEVGRQTSLPIRVLLGERSLVALSGVQHQRHRKLLMPPFHGERMKSYGETMIEITKQVISQWQVGKPFSLRTYTQDISLRVILETIFGLDKGEKFDRLRKLLVEWLDIFNSPFRSSLLFFPLLQKDLGAWSPWGQFIRLKRMIHEILDTEIDRRRNNPATLGEDILSLMLLARDQEDQPMSNEEIRDELMTMLFAGHETTANSLAWAFYWLHYVPEIEEKLKQELNSLEGNLDFNTINKLPYLNAVVSETLRLHPVVALIGRQLKAPFEIMGYTFEAGTSLFPAIYLTHQREDIYPEPKKFKPERFLERQFSPYEYLPFGGGNRRCLGYAFALFEMKLVLATILSEVELELLDRRFPKTVRRGITFAPAGGVRMRVKKYKN
ncbi:Unspecific monooxygenase [Stanieria cyanosphaera PCC 7437]|uniref:Unspecific monooxygenase n=1 Tax=Stanieria cyanosphaera (strain ATCC 29371 / PCC 7437) TaxID=111780 RepID=K9XYD7_STAC7|nr:cytochrome P450 [Stanieria cyanosphaera]AFZ37131.1 Unspecific monooxygenase [Stanieria cyanosphaera PCC 7437]